MSEGWRRINTLDEISAGAELLKCCGSRRWADAMLARRPFTLLDQVAAIAGEIWDSLSREDYLEAFSHHPRIGEKSLREKFATTATWASGEQSGVNVAGDDIIKELASLNDEYAGKFGYIFIVCATGKSAAEMLDILRSRLANPLDIELPIAAAEQKKITEIRLRKL
jgi:2-oxo-4-hydroxy-4-carboxy-5-ureidoimidazoline decarboxylase